MAWLFVSSVILILLVSGIPFKALLPFFSPVKFLIAYQFLPIFLAFVGLLALRKKLSLKLERRDFLLMGLTVLVALLAHFPHLHQQFFKEDVSVQIIDVLEPSQSSFHARLGRLYPLTPLDFIYLVVGNKPVVFAAFGLLMQLVNAASIFILVLVLTRHRAIATAAASLWAASPAFLEGFSWLGVSTGSGLAIFVALWAMIVFGGVVSKNLTTPAYQVLSTSFIIAALNLGFVRVGALPFLAVLIPPYIAASRRERLLVLIKRYWLPLVIGIVGVILMFKGTIGGGNAIGNRPLTVPTFVTTFFLLGASVVPLEFQKLVVAQFNQWYALHLLVMLEILLPLGVVALARDPKVRNIGLFGWFWFAIGMIPMVIGGGNQSDVKAVYDTVTQFPYMPGIKQVQFAYVGYAIVLAAAIYSLTDLVGMIGKRFARPIRASLFTLATVALVGWFAASSFFYHRQFNQTISAPLGKLLEIINQHPIAPNEYLLVWAPHQTPASGFLDSSRDLSLISKHKKILYAVNETVAKELAQTHPVLERNILLIEFDPRNGELIQLPFTGFQ